MLTEQESMELKEGDLFPIILAKGFLENSELVEKLKYVIQLEKPLYVLKERDYNIPADLLNGANIQFCLEYDPKDFEEANQTLMEKIKEDLGLDSLVSAESYVNPNLN